MSSQNRKLSSEGVLKNKNDLNKKVTEGEEETCGTKDREWYLLAEWK